MLSLSPRRVRVRVRVVSTCERALEEEMVKSKGWCEGFLVVVVVVGG